MQYHERVWAAHLEWIKAGQHLEALHLYATLYDVEESDIWDQHLVFYD